MVVVGEQTNIIFEVISIIKERMWVLARDRVECILVWLDANIVVAAKKGQRKQH